MNLLKMEVKMKKAQQNIKHLEKAIKILNEAL
jgi:hypothetical protein